MYCTTFQHYSGAVRRYSYLPWSHKVLLSDSFYAGRERGRGQGRKPPHVCTRRWIAAAFAGAGNVRAAVLEQCGDTSCLGASDCVHAS